VPAQAIIDLFQDKNFFLNLNLVYKSSTLEQNGFILCN